VSLLTRVSAGVARARGKAPWLDHLVQAGQRYGADQGNQLAAAVTYFSFLSLFPLLLLTVSVLGFVLAGHPDLTARVIKGISDALPGQSKDAINGAIHSRKAVGLIGLLGLLYAGLGWVGNLRTAIRTVWHQNVNAGNIVTSKLNDLLILAGLGLALIASVAISGVGNAATSFVTRTLSLAGVPGIGVITRVVTIAIAMAANVVIFLYLFVRLPRVQTPWRRSIKGAVFAAVGFEILKMIGAFYVARTTRNATATYGALGVVIGALVWINLVCRFVIFAAVWTVTAPYDDDVPPSGTADPKTAQPAGNPTDSAEGATGAANGSAASG
jgi:membrane protein